MGGSSGDTGRRIGLEVSESTSGSRGFPVRSQASQDGFSIGVEVNFQNVNPSYTEGLVGKHPKPNKVDLPWSVLAASPAGAKDQTQERFMVR